MNWLLMHPIKPNCLDFLTNFLFTLFTQLLTNIDLLRCFKFCLYSVISLTCSFLFPVQGVYFVSLDLN